LAAPAIRVDEQARDVWVHGLKLEPPLPFRDFEVLLLLYRNREKACSKDELARAWGSEFVTDEQIEQSIHRIRKRIEPNPSGPTRIVTVRGYGYKLTLPTQGP
jgi:two-component system response regulator RegX3